MNDDLQLEEKNEKLNDELDLELNMDQAPPLVDAPIVPEVTETKSTDTDSITISKNKLAMIKQALQILQEQNRKLNDLLAPYFSGVNETEFISKTELAHTADDAQDGKVVEGTFDGENMIGPDGKQYSVPANYASKSKLVEGDTLKLTIAPAGNFLYKQIGPIDRDRVVGTLEKSANGNFYVAQGSKKWRVLTASVTYYKGQPGDEAVIMIPKTHESNWAALDNIMKK